MEQQAPDLAIILITGPENPKRIPSAFFLGAAAAAEGMNVAMYFTGSAAMLLNKGVAENLYPMEGGKSIADFMKLAIDNGVKVIGCLQSLDLNGMKKEDISLDIPLLTPTAALPTLGMAKRVLTW